MPGLLFLDGKPCENDENYESRRVIPDLKPLKPPQRKTSSPTRERELMCEQLDVLRHELRIECLEKKIGMTQREEMENSLRDERDKLEREKDANERAKREREDYELKISNLEKEYTTSTNVCAIKTMKLVKRTMSSP